MGPNDHRMAPDVPEDADIALGPMPEQVEVRALEEDWTGLTDPVMRRKLQNRLNQRIYRRRRRVKPSTKPLESEISNTTSSQSEGPISAEEQSGTREVIISNAATSSNRIGSGTPQPEISTKRQRSIHTMSRGEIQQTMAKYEAAAHQDYALGSPRVDQLLTLIQFNVFRALVGNTFAAGFTMDWLDGEAISPWCAGTLDGRNTSCPPSLRPTALQKTVPHHPWIDLFPISQMRDNLLRNYDSLDEDSLCNDLVDFFDVSNEQTGLIVWNVPWQPSGWEVSETFLRKWSWVTKGCDDLVKSTNYWRSIRGEEALDFDTYCLLA